MNYLRALVIAMGVIAVFFLIIFLVSHFMQPILPPDVNSSVLRMVTSLLGAMMLLAFLNNILDLVRKVFGNQDETKIERFERTFEDYLRSIKVYCKEFPYLSIGNLLEGERKSLSEIYVPLKARSKRDNPTQEDSIYGKLNSPRETCLRTCRDWRKPGTQPSKNLPGQDDTYHLSSDRKRSGGVPHVPRAAKRCYRRFAGVAHTNNAYYFRLP